MIRTLICSLGLCSLAISAQAAEAPHKPRNVVLVTLDGVRVQEMFGGIDVSVVASKLHQEKPEDTDLYKRYWAPTREERRAKIMPFFWGTLMKQHGWIAGDSALGSHVEVTNHFHSSYPGYAEMLTGRAQDEVIINNIKLRNPRPTVLEFVKRELKLPREQVATFASWDHHKLIVEHEPGATYINAGFMPYEDANPVMHQLNLLQTEARAWNDERFDEFTGRFAFDYLQRVRPRLLYVMFGETDDFAHDGNYEFVLESLTRADRFLQKFWTWLQAQPQYRDNTTLIVTTDHGRGKTPYYWGTHGEDIGPAKDIWIAVASPDDARRGELSHGPTLYQKQIAATIAQQFGLDYSKQDPDAGKPIPLSSN